MRHGSPFWRRSVYCEASLPAPHRGPSFVKRNVILQWTLQPIAGLVAEEISTKLGGAVTIDVMRALQANDAGSRSRAPLTVTQALAAAKEAGLAPGDLSSALKLVDRE